MREFRCVFLTGAGSGIGMRLAEMALGRGAAVAGFDARPEGLAKLSQTAADSGGRLHSAVVDVRQDQELADAIGAAAERLGPPDLAINCAGILLSKPFAELTSQEFTRVIEVNLIGSRNFAAAALPLMGRGSRLALVASMAGLVANYSYAAYGASKYGVLGLAEVLRLEYKPRGIDVSVICPPEVETSMVYAERKTMHPVSRSLKRTAGTMDVETACAEIFSSLQKGRFLIIPSRRARAVAWVARHVPKPVVHAGTDLAVRLALSRSGAGN
jgi:3-dehydrosphinganine reductase